MSGIEIPGTDLASGSDALPWQRPAIVDAVGQAIEQELARFGKEAVVKSVRFIPSTLSTKLNGDLQMIANTIVEVKGAIPGRSEVLESVVTIDPTDANGLRDVSTHSLQRRAFA
ncbi:hypothetical protein VH567_05550 [Sphingomonas sp. 4RDLI-65]|uniref:hypothetical protein n=1 Tax=Sphingomonas sp. 4RDLI-65 TaxID=3111641 RepID=UPI003C25A925